MEKQKVLQSVKDAVHEVDSKAEIILYGSRARGDNHDESDWDFLVLLEDGEDFNVMMKINEPLYYQELETGEVFSLITHSTEYWEKLQLSYFYKEVKKDGIII